MARVELVAPAGSPEMFLAACEAGADAVYVGVRGFGEGAGWRGCTVSEISSLQSLARSRNVKLHVYLDSVLKEDELTGLLDLVLSIARLKPDLWVVQDAGMLQLLKMISTGHNVQAGLNFTIHNRDGIQAAQRLGADGVAVIPEVHVNDLTRMVSTSKVPVEILVHGPMRYGLPGQCLFSSFLDGNSANRGRCSEPFRMSFQVNGEDQRLFATRHLDTRSILPQLVASGVSSIRIAGRGTPLDVMEETVRDYRRLLNNIEKGREEDSSRGGNRRRRLNGHAGSVGYYLGGKTDLLDPQASSRRGIFLGTIQQMNQDTIGITPERPFRLGDNLEIRDESGAEAFSFVVKDIYLRNRRVRRGRPGEQVRIGVPRLFRKGDSVYRINQGEESNNKVRELMRGFEPRRSSADLELTWLKGRLKTRLTIEGHTFEDTLKYTPGKEAIDVSEAALRQHFEPPSSCPFELASFKVTNEPEVRPNIWDLKSIATNLYRSAETGLSDRRELLRREMESALRRSSRLAAPEEESERFRVHVRDLELVKGLNPGPDVTFSVGIAPRTVENTQAVLDKGDIDPEQVALVLPPWLWDGDLKDFRARIEKLVEGGIHKWVVENIGHFELLRDLDITIQTGPRLPAYNSICRQSFESLGAHVVSLAVEDDAENWEHLAARTSDVQIEVPLYGHPALCTSRSRPQNINERTPVRVADGPRIRLARGAEWTELRTWEPVSLCGYRKELSNQGYHRFLIDLSQDTWSRERFESILDAARAGEPVEGASLFNYRRGLR